MDNTDLYNEEQLQELKSIAKQLKGSAIVPIPQIPETMKATIVNEITAKVVGDITVNDKPFNALSSVIKSELELTTASIVKAVLESVQKPQTEVTVKNIEGAKTKTVTVDNLAGLEKQINRLVEKVVENRPIVNVEKQTLDMPTSANNPISVRLSDGKSFYNAILSAVSGSASFTDTNGRGVQVVLTASGKVPVEATIGVSSPTTVYNGKKTVTTAGTRVALATTQTVKSVTIKALNANTGTIYVGNSTVASTNGLELLAGDTVNMDIADLATVYIDSSVNGEGVTYIGVN